MPEEIKSIFDALKKIKEMTGTMKIGSSEMVQIAAVKELKNYIDVILKDHFQVKPSFSVISKRESESEEVYVCELVFKDAVHLYESLALNISKGGCFIKEDDLLSIDSNLELNIRLEREKIDFMLEGKVIWINPRDTQGRPKGMGVKFNKLSPTQKEILDGFANGDLDPEALRLLNPI
ncbi:MAG: PilZ domain-containing protein [Deltaproteobacteria bacterium]|nr:PilZ domain-containing protein [Deltaproteobacteria bacterium]